MFEFLLVNQQMPGTVSSSGTTVPSQQPGAVSSSQPTVPGPGQMQQPMQQQYPQQGMQPQPITQNPQLGTPNGDVQMGDIVKWAGAGGAASGAIQGVLSIVSGFDIINILMTVGIAAVLGILTAIVIGQFGSKIPVQGTVMVKSAAMMFVLNIITGFIFGMGVGAIGTILGIAGIGGGAFLYGWLLQKKIPNLI